YTALKSWPLAITAYNHGLNGMKRAVAACGSRDIADIIQRHSSRSFRFASKNFYSCFLAACEIAMEPEKYFSVVTYAPPIQYNTTTLSHYITPTTLADHLKIPLQTLKTLNPALRPVVFQHNKPIPRGTRLRIPVTLTVADAHTAIESIPDSLKLTTPPKPRYYRVRRGDNLYAIARRLDVTVSAIALENNISRLNRIYAGQVLRVPGVEPRKTTVATASKPTKPKPVTQKPEPPVVAAEPETVEVVHTDSLPPEELPDTLKAIAMKAADTIPETPSSAVSPTFARFDASIYDLAVSVSPSGGNASIIVSVNETIGHYGEWLDIPTYRVRRLNRMGRRSGIRLGQHISIVSDPDKIERFKQRRLEYHLGLEEDFYSQYRVSELKPHTIKRGETIWEICNEEGDIPLWLLKKHNRNLDLARLHAGMRIWVPVVAEKTDEQIAFPASDDTKPEATPPPAREPSRAPFSPVRLIP
ncbi:MAG: LysM peptidoglycan-binding domain-containing protein, partial [Chitinivibrionales bacterium]|nr:LysM peptidoglycan-binding domain-containing protein [Chitinivibrionales bacterium]